MLSLFVPFRWKNAIVLNVKAVNHVGNAGVAVKWLYISRKLQGALPRPSILRVKIKLLKPYTESENVSADGGHGMMPGKGCLVALRLEVSARRLRRFHWKISSNLLPRSVMLETGRGRLPLPGRKALSTKGRPSASSGDVP
jgi:hypothetical protein